MSVMEELPKAPGTRVKERITTAAEKIFVLVRFACCCQWQQPVCG